MFFFCISVIYKYVIIHGMQCCICCIPWGKKAIDYLQELHYPHELLKFANEMKSNVKLLSDCCHRGFFCVCVNKGKFVGSQAGKGWLTGRVSMKMDGPSGRRVCVNWEVGSIHYIKINNKQLLNRGTVFPSLIQLTIQTTWASFLWFMKLKGIICL